MSSTKHPLELLLQNQLGTDESAIKYLPNVLNALQQADIFGEARVLGKWNARIHSFLHSREGASRWVGLYLARYTALGSRQILVDNSQGWVGVVLPMLSKPEPPPNHYAAIRLLSYIFTAVTDMPEFQRQVVIPNVQKYSQALLAIAKNPESEFELKLLCIDSLTQLTTYHPSHHKAIHQQLFNFTLEHLQGSFPLPSNAPLVVENKSSSLITSVVRLHASLALTGGKVGAGMIWRQSLDSTMGTIWVVLETLRSTYLDVPRPSTTIAPFSLPELPADPALAGPIALDRFRSMIHLLVYLLETPTSRPVSIPLGQLAHLALTLLRFSTISQPQSTNMVYEAVQRVNEVAVVPELCVAGCMLAQKLAQTCGKLFTPYVSQIFVAITLQLEQNITAEHRTRLLATIPPLLANTHNPSPSTSYNRLAAQVLKVLTPLLPSSRTYTQTQMPQENAKGKKRARYEGDELFASHPSSNSSSLQLPTHDELHIAALLALAALLPTLPTTTQTTIHRTWLALLLHLPRTGNFRRLTQEMSRVYACALGESSTGTLSVGVQALQSIEVSHDMQSTPGLDQLSTIFPLFWKDEEDEEAKEFRQTAGIAIAKEVLARKQASETPENIDVITDAIKDRDSDAPNMGENGVANGLSVSSTSAVAPTPRSTFQPPAPPVAPTPPIGHNLAPPASPPPIPTNTSLPTSATPEATTAIPASSLFRSSGTSSGITQISTTLAPVAGPSSLQTTILDDDDDEPMPQIDLGSDSDDEA
ncbi:hypothetical protein OPQ81_004077 [Rhizoctonia solani]|nr:hypothetical protein OPQ81_004077 [Rhizoctonia solani]